MNRREAIERVGLIMGGTIIGAEFFITDRTPTLTHVNILFEADNIVYLNEIAETILPETSSPGAKMANVGQFIAEMVKDCYTPADQKIFIEGLQKLNELSVQQFANKFVQLSVAQRTVLLIALDKEQKDYYCSYGFKIERKWEKAKMREGLPADLPNHYFRMMKELTLLGYFTSKIGATVALRYIETPGSYNGNLAYIKGDKAWMDDGLF